MCLTMILRFTINECDSQSPCLFGFNVALTSEVIYFDQCAATLECDATDTGHDTPPRHSIQIHGRPVVVLSIDVELHTEIHNYPFEHLG